MKSYKPLFALAATLALVSVSFAQSANAASLDQYATSATATSNYSGYGPEKAAGAPNVTSCSDDPNSWASQTARGADVLTLGFATAVAPSQIKVWMNVDQSTLTMIEVAGSDNVWTTVFTRSYADALTTGASCTATPAPHTITTALVTASGHSWPTSPVNQVRLSFDQANSYTSWGGETDAVQLTGSAASATSLTKAAKVSGTAKVGKTLSLTTASFAGSPTPTKTIKWYACSKAVSAAATKVPTGCSAISGAKASTLKLKAAQKGKYISALVTASNGIGASKYSFTKSTAKVAN